MLSKSLSLLSEALQWNLAQSVEQFGLRRWSRQQFPSALTLSHAPREPLLTGDSEHLTPSISEKAFDLIVGPRQTRHIIAMEEARPIAPAYFIQYCGQNLGRLFGNNTIVAKGFVLRAGFFQTQPVS